MLNWTDDDRPYVEALVALETVSRKLLAQELRETTYMGETVWSNLWVVAKQLQLAWRANRLARLRNNMAMRAR